jgi:hypothetical protein
MTPKPVEILHVVILREMWGEFFTLQLDNGQTEELEPEEIRQWFKIRGADMDKMEKVFDHVWNFGHAEVEIENPKAPPVTRLPYAPDI